MQRTISHIANGVLLYALFYAVAWALMVKGALVLPVFADGEGLWAKLDTVAIPFSVSILAAFLAHAGLRLTLKRLRLALSTPEYSASWSFLAVLTVLAFSGALSRLFDAPGGGWMTPAAIVVGAWAGVALRRRIAI